MPRLPEGAEEYGWDSELPGTRFVTRPAFPIPIPETEWGTYEGKPEDALRAYLGDWILEDQPEIGRSEPVNGSAGRGADAWIPVVEFVAVHVAGGVIAPAAANGVPARMAACDGGSPGSGARMPEVSRGGAAVLALAHVADEYSAESVEVQAAEERTSVGGAAVTELSYTGIEPWIVLLLDRRRRLRYVVVVGPGGDILGSIEAPLSELEELYLSS